MKNKFTPLLLCFVTFCACMHAAQLTHRYDFNGDANDSFGSLNGILTIDNSSSNLEAPLFTTDIPGSADTSFASNSIEFGMSIGTKASSVNFGSSAQTKIFDNKAGSFSYWFKADQLMNGRDFVSNISGTTGLRTLLRNDGKLRLVGAGMSSPVDFTFATAVTAGTWHHLVVAWDDPNGTLKIALDGSIQTHAFSAGALEDPARLIAGNYSENSQNLNTQFDGKLFDLQIYQGMLSDDAITMLAANAGTSYSVPEPQHYSLLINLLVFGHVLARRRRPAN